MKAKFLRLQLWLPVVFSFAICYFFLDHHENSMPNGLGSLIRWTPMCFVFVSISVSNYLSSLEKRLSTLETKVHPMAY